MHDRGCGGFRPHAFLAGDLRAVHQCASGGRRGLILEIGAVARCQAVRFKRRVVLAADIHPSRQNVRDDHIVQETASGVFDRERRRYRVANQYVRGFRLRDARPHHMDVLA